MDDVQILYRLRFQGREPYRDAVWRVLCADFFQRWIPPDSAVLDLGCGYCDFINHIQAARRLGMDLNPDAARLAAPGVEVLLQNCADPWQVDPASLDVVFTSNFFEHLPDKPALESTLFEARRALRPGGRLIALGPNLRYVHGAYWDFYDHHLPLTDKSLAEALRKNGFRVTHSEPRFLPYSMSSGCRYPVGLLHLYLRLPWIWPLFGKQFLLMAQR
jgi:SAM-dependent methyltransferase